MNADKEEVLSAFIGVHRRLILLTVVYLVGCATHVAPPDPSLWGNLQPGPYRVGWGLKWETDPTRLYGADRKPRPIPVGVWYPARDSSAPHIAIGDYYETRPGLPQFDPLATRLNAYMRKNVDADKLFPLRTAATRDAPSAKGPFPVVIYNPGNAGNYADNSTLFEYLASSGYIVLSTSYHCEDSKLVGPCLSAVRARDMIFLDRFSTALAIADPTRVAAIAEREGAQMALSWASEPDTPLAAVVGLNLDPSVTPAKPTLPVLLLSGETLTHEQRQKIRVFLDDTIKKVR
jgi:hypothetical protein